jgi:hypothetical protein
MSIQIYKPNKNNSGFAFSFYMGENFKDKTPILFMNAIAQHSWDASRRIGSFSANKGDPEKNISIKFNEFECGSIVSAVRNRFEWSTYHAFEENKTQIKLSPWDKKVKVSKLNSSTKEYYEENITVPAFGLSVVRNGNQTFKIPLEPGEVECLRVLCETVISKNCEIKSYTPSKSSGPKDYDF